MTIENGLLAGGWVAWCALHSLTATDGGRAWVRAHLRWLDRWYRLSYNLLAVLTLAPLLWWRTQLPEGPLLVVWSGFWQWLQAGLWLVACGLFIGGLQVYPLREFVGLPGTIGDAPGTGRPLVTTGLLGVVRHPWYLGGLLVLWARDLGERDLVVALILSLYLVVGAHLEERRLIARFGAEYRAYRQRVPMLFPRLLPRRRAPAKRS